MTEVSVTPAHASYREALPRLAVLALWAVAACLLFLPTVRGMVEIWSTSDTFAHGFVVAPISLWLLWRMRDRLLAALPRGPSPWLLLFMLPLLPLWLAGNLVDVQVVQQLAFVGVLVVGLAALAGWHAARAAAFPLGFLFLAVPMGLSLEPPMMDLTAVYTVKLIQATGIPVYQEGRFFQLPSGNWSVVEACSGVRYLIASITLGLIYAHLSYRSLWRKLAFVGASIAVPVVANVLRAYLIVMLGHLSGMRLATGVDHLVYGWVFFGAVMLLLFWIGGFWAEGGESEDDRIDAPGLAVAVTGSRSGWGTLLVALALAAPVTALGERMAGSVPPHAPTAFEPILAGTWQCGEESGFPWRPVAAPSDRRLALACSSGEGAGGEVALIADQYFSNSIGSGVGGYYSRVAGDGEQGVRVLSDDIRNIAVSGGTHQAVQETRLRMDSGEQVLIRSWYLLDDHRTASRARVKLLQAWLRLLGQPYVAARVYLGVVLKDDAENAAQAALDRFMAANGPALDRALAGSGS